MAGFLLFATAAIGLTNIIVTSSIMAPVREWLRAKLSPQIYEVFECHQCMGFWAGLVCGLFLLCPYMQVFLYAFAGSFLATIAYVFLEFLLSKTDFEINIGDVDETQEDQ